MRSHVSAVSAADDARAAWRLDAERALRVCALLVLVIMIALAARPSTEQPAAIASGSDIGPALIRWSAAATPERVHVVLDSVPSPETRDWLVAMRKTSARVTWEGDALTTSAIQIIPVADPRNPARILVAAPPASMARLSDDLGMVDSVLIHAGGATITVPHLSGVARVITGSSAATAIIRDSVLLRPVLVLGTAGWEAKFVVAALEEHGWKVEARLAVSPNGDVAQSIVDAARVAPTPVARGADTAAVPRDTPVVNPNIARLRAAAAARTARVAALRARTVQPSHPLTIDTSRYSAVIAIDTVALRYAAQIIAYVESGGGLVAVGEGAGLSALAPILPAVADRSKTALSQPPDSAAPREMLAMTPLAQLRSDAVVLERQKSGVSIAGWRAGNGRALQVGYRDTWRWRMSGVESDPVAAHRIWWSALLSSVAYAPLLPISVHEGVEPTPLATLVASLGPSARSSASLLTTFRANSLTPILFGILLCCLFAEWVSRRTRGTA